MLEVSEMFLNCTDSTHLKKNVYVHRYPQFLRLFVKEHPIADHFWSSGTVNTVCEHSLPGIAGEIQRDLFLHCRSSAVPLEMWKMPHESIIQRFVNSDRGFGNNVVNIITYDGGQRHLWVNKRSAAFITDNRMMCISDVDCGGLYDKIRAELAWKYAGKYNEEDGWYHGV